MALRVYGIPTYPSPLFIAVHPFVFHSLPRNQIFDLSLKLKTRLMKKLLLVKEIYLEGFRNLGHILLEKYFKIFAWFSFIMFFIVLYAFVYRIATGYAFD
ncbi:MAG: hypothetical protein CMH46_04110 [Muricauda sp.]|nr:hypothetical protein [Allomuricauda sp.]|tara:strand:- start:43969 stop:44268 length:300 start_codon:yes stop_codon:yes gene_type:complete